MKHLQRFLMGLGTVVLLAVSLQLAAPKAVHAVVSTLVTIANTPSNPVYTTDAVNSENLLQVTCAMSFASSNGSDISNKNCYTVPAGQRALIEQVDGICSTQTGTAIANVNLYVDPQTQHQLPLTLENGSTDLNFYTFSVPSHYYSAVNATFMTYAGASPGAAANCYVNVSGRLMPAN
ncbi:MAG: hypothetical protein ABSG16_18865 [Candidatus Acidiferrum sp.]|jgi:hypothetical protein